MNFGHFRKHVEHLDANQATERDCDDIHEGLIKLSHRNEHNNCSLVNGFPSPNQEGLSVERATFLNSLVERGKASNLRVGDIDVEHEGKHWETRVYGRVTKYKVAVVNGNGHEEVEASEDGLNERYYHTSMHYELT